MQRFFRSIEFIEEHLYEKISIHDIAAASFYSTFHFSRIFRSLVGDSPKEYLRKRRLTIAANRLLREDISILDVALQCQFESQEAFTRAFKALFKVTPAQFRKEKHPYRLLYRDQFSPHTLHHLKMTVSLTPEIVTKPEVKIVGVANRYTDKDLSIRTFWSAFRPFMDNIPNRADNNAFGIYECYEEDSEGHIEFSYICSVPVKNFDEVPDGMITRTIPAQTYAVFQHRDDVDSLNETLKYIWGNWLPKSDYEYVEKPDFELFPEGFPENPLRLYIPVGARVS